MHGMHLLRHVRGNPEIAIKMKPKQDCVALYSPCARLSWHGSGGSNPLRVKVSHQPVN